MKFNPKSIILERFVAKLGLGIAIAIVGVSATAGLNVASKSTSTVRVNKPNRSAVTVVESVLAGTTTPVMNVFSGPVGVTGQGMAMIPSQNTGSGSASSLGLPSVPVLPLVDAAATKDQILASAKSNLLPRASDVGTSLTGLMSSQGYKAANFIFEQSIKPVGSPSYVKVIWQVTVLENGRIIYADPRVTDPDPYYVYAVYTSKQVAAGLPSSLAYADGGKFKWQLIKKDGTPLTAMTSLDVGGAFDVITVADGTSYDPDWGVKCLANLASGACPTISGFTDVKTLISSNSATGSVIDYMRKLEPVYTDKGDGTQQAVMSISFDSRKLTHNNSCTNGTFRTQGRYGLTLNSTYDRFSYDGLSAPVLMGRSNSTSFSPTQTFDNSRVTSLSAAGLGNSAINPFSQSNDMVDASTISGVQYIAPISEDGNSGRVKETITYNGTTRECSASDPYIPNLYGQEIVNGPWNYCDGDSGCYSGDGPHWEWVSKSTVQVCGGHMWWGTDYSFGIDRATGQGWTVHWYYGTQWLHEKVTVKKENLPCP